MQYSKSILLLTLALIICISLRSQDTLPDLKGLKFRSLGPAFNSGRVSDIAVHPENHNIWYIAAASGGIWKTNNHGNTFKPIFDNYGSYSIACLSIDPKNPNIIWAGTGENNNQRSVAYGDGLYKSIDGGNTWKKMGLENSEHIGNIIIHPDNSEIIYVAAYGPLWSKGGERGIYKTTDGGKNWERILHVDEHTGFNEVHFEPGNPEVLYAAAHQRRRHVWTYISGGPSSGIYKSTNGGLDWTKLDQGLPKSDLGRIGLEIAPSDPNIVYAMIEAEGDAGGFYKSTNRGASWKKQSKYRTSGNYYVEIYCDPHNSDKIFSMDTWLHHSTDGGKTFVKTGEKSKHVDNHAIWIDPNDTNHWILGCDGGIYETWDHADNWHFKPNLPITQFYKVAIDNDVPFYNLYGGTQDNNTLGGPSRTINNAGIANSDWFVTRGGDGFESQVDPKDPNIVYSQAQYGWLDRYDKRSGERVGIKPMPKKKDEILKWNWDSPLLISPHNHKRLYFGANKLFRSDDRGNNWTEISDDLTRKIDRNTLKVMDRIWGLDAVSKNRSTSNYGNLTAIDESPFQEDRLVVGTDDGLLHFTDDAGQNWRKVDRIDQIPERTYVNDLKYSLHTKDRLFAVFNNHKMGDFKPYLFMSSDNGISWENISENLPERGSVYSIEEDHIDPNLLFCGTEFGVFFSHDMGKNWHPLKNGLPTIAIRDMEIQRRENDLVLASFGRGFYILDDYSPLRYLDSIMDSDQFIFPIKDGLLYVESNPLGTKGKSSQGESYFISPNPKPGVTITFFNKQKIKSIKEQRKEKDEELKKENKSTNYPSKDQIMIEDKEQSPLFLFEIKDDKGESIAKLRQKPMRGIQRIHWNGRRSSQSPLSLKERKPGRYSSPDWGALALEGNYSVSMYLLQNGKIDTMVIDRSFKLKHLENLSTKSENEEDRDKFIEEISNLRKSIMGSQKSYQEFKKKVEYLEKAILDVPKIPISYLEQIHDIKERLELIGIELNGNQSLSKRYFATTPSLSSRIQYAHYSVINNRQKPTGTAKEMYTMSKDIYENEIRPSLNEVIQKIKQMEKELDQYDIPFTPGRGSDWKND
jgi:photosystem II stability/assembly factor-like uncharacterized protein